MLISVQGSQDPQNQRDLVDYCASDEGIDTIVVAFLSSFGNGVFPSGYLGNCYIDENGNGNSGCQKVASDIDSCKSMGKKIFLSIAGGGSDWELNSAADARGVAYSLFNSFANPAYTSNSPRPLGNTFVNGWDMDFEDNPNHEAENYLGDLVNALRGYFSNDPDNTYYISGAPQCPIAEPNMGNSLMESQYDYLWIQFYNNNCAAREAVSDENNPYGNGQYNLADWPGYLAGGASANAKLYTGIPAAKKSADYPYFYIPTAYLGELLGHSEGVAGFNGFMIYDAGDSDIPQVDGCNYAQNVRRVLDTGDRC